MGVELGLSTHPGDRNGVAKGTRTLLEVSSKSQGTQAERRGGQGTLVGPVRTPERDTRKRGVGEEIGNRTLPTSVHLWHYWAGGRKLT